MSSAEARREDRNPAHNKELTHKKARIRRIDFPQVTDCGESLPYKPAEKRLFPRVPVYFGDGLGERNTLGAGMHTVLRVSAFLDAPGTHERTKPFTLVHRSSRVQIEESHLADNRRTHELIILIYLRANFQAVPTSDAVRKRVAFFLNFRGHARALAKIVSAIDGNPCLHAFQTLKHKLPIHREIAHQRKFRHRFDSNRLLKLIHKRRASHPRFPIDQHRARSANLLQAIRIVRNRGGLFTVARHGILRDVAQTNDYIHRRPPLERKFLPARRLSRPRLSFHSDDDLFCFRHSPSTIDCLEPEDQSNHFYFAAS